MKSFKHDYAMAFPAQIRGGGQACRTAADDRNGFTCVGSDLRHLVKAVFSSVIGDKALDPTDRNGLFHILFRFAYGAVQLALDFLGTDPSADGGKQARFLDDRSRPGIVSLSRFKDEGGNIDFNGTSFDAGFGFTLKTPQRFDADLGFGISEGDLVHIEDPLPWILGGHLLQGNLISILGREFFLLKLGKQQLCGIIKLFFLRVHLYASPSLISKQM
jgi:hypothetical protein